MALDSVFRLDAKMNIRPETPADHAAIRSVIESAFGHDLEAGLVEELRASGDDVIALVAESAEGRVVGHIMLSKLERPEHCLALAPLSVARAHQGKGIGATLMEEALVRARADGWNAAFVLGNPKYYAHAGFSVAAAEKFFTVYPKQYFMARELAPGGLKNLSGAVVYPEPFLEVD